MNFLRYKNIEIEIENIEDYKKSLESFYRKNEKIEKHKNRKPFYVEWNLDKSKYKVIELHRVTRFGFIKPRSIRLISELTFDNEKLNISLKIHPGGIVSMIFGSIIMIYMQICSWPIPLFGLLLVLYLFQSKVYLKKSENELIKLLNEIKEKSFSSTVYSQ